MLIIKQPNELRSHIQSLKKLSKRIGFVPTMGALHSGHISLIKASKNICDVNVCSIFVNPTQFNNANDLSHYPRTLEADIKLLENEECDVLFLPEKNALYTNEKSLTIDFGALAESFEGTSRPGHFEGVARVLRIFFDLIQPDDVFLGMKDFQQCQIIRSLVEFYSYPILLHFEPTKREADGLAMSSRNVRLSEQQRNEAPAIYRALCSAKSMINTKPVPEIVALCIQEIENEAELQVDYFEIANALTLEPVNSVESGIQLVALAAVYAGEVRLIDNLLLK